MAVVHHVNNGFTMKELVELLLDGNDDPYSAFENAVQPWVQLSRDSRTFTTPFTGNLELYRSNTKPYVSITRIYNFVLEHLMVDFEILDVKRIKSVIGDYCLADGLRYGPCFTPEGSETPELDLYTKTSTITTLADIDEEREPRTLTIRKYDNISNLGVTEDFIDAIAQIMTCMLIL